MNTLSASLCLQPEQFVRMVKVVDPGSYWVSPVTAIDPSELHKYLVKDIDECYDFDFSPIIGECVLVTGLKDGLCYRGIVTNIDDITSGGKHNSREDGTCGRCYRVLLVDKGEAVCIEGGGGRVRPLRGAWVDLPPQCCLVSIYGLVPPSLLTFDNIKDRDFSKRVVAKWEEDSEIVRGVVPKGRVVIFKRRKFIDGTAYGDLFTEEGLDIGRELFERGIARISESFETDLLIFQYHYLEYAEELKATVKHRTKDCEREEPGKTTESGRFVCPSDHLLYLNLLSHGLVTELKDPDTLRVSNPSGTKTIGVSERKKVKKRPHRTRFRQKRRMEGAGEDGGGKSINEKQTNESVIKAPISDHNGFVGTDPEKSPSGRMSGGCDSDTKVIHPSDENCCVDVPPIVTNQHKLGMGRGKLLRKLPVKQTSSDGPENQKKSIEATEEMPKEKSLKQTEGSAPEKDFKNGFVFTKSPTTSPIMEIPAKSPEDSRGKKSKGIFGKKGFRNENGGEVRGSERSSMMTDELSDSLSRLSLGWGRIPSGLESQKVGLNSETGAAEGNGEEASSPGTDLKFADADSVLLDCRKDDCSFKKVGTKPESEKCDGSQSIGIKNPSPQGRGIFLDRYLKNAGRVTNRTNISGDICSGQFNDPDEEDGTLGESSFGVGSGKNPESPFGGASRVPPSPQTSADTSDLRDNSSTNASLKSDSSITEVKVQAPVLGNTPSPRQRAVAGRGLLIENLKRTNVVERKVEKFSQDGAGDPETECELGASLNETSGNESGESPRVGKTASVRHKGAGRGLLLEKSSNDVESTPKTLPEDSDQDIGKSKKLSSVSLESFDRFASNDLAHSSPLKGFGRGQLFNSFKSVNSSGLKTADVGGESSGNECDRVDESVGQKILTKENGYCADVSTDSCFDDLEASSCGDKETERSEGESPSSSQMGSDLNLPSDPGTLRAQPQEDTIQIRESIESSVEECSILPVSFSSVDGSSEDETEVEDVVAKHAVPEPSFSDQDSHEPVDSSQVISYHPVPKSDVSTDSGRLASDFTVGAAFERIKSSGTLVHGDVSINQVTSVHDLNLNVFIYDNLQKKLVRDLTRCQIYSVPVLLEWRNLVLIGPPNSGKSLAYVVPILSLLLNMNLYSELKEGNGPRLVVVTSSARSVRHVGRMCSAVSVARVSVITTHGGGQDMERKSELTNGCDVLITTPRSWLRLLKYSFVTNVNRLCHLVFDEIDVLLELFKPEVMKILQMVETLVANRKKMNRTMGVQMVFVGETWNPSIEEITLNRLERPVLCMTAYMEAALYARIKPITYIIKPKEKFSKLNELLKQRVNMRGMILCQSVEEVRRLQPIVLTKKSNLIIAHQEMSSTMLTEARNNWFAGTGKEPPTLLCDDEVVNELGITDVQWLLHYSLPVSRTDYNARFSVIMDNFQDRILNRNADVPDCKVDILVDDTNEDQFPEVIKFMSRLSTRIPDKIKNVVKKLKLQKEMKKDKVPMCTNLLQLGNCWKEARCSDQHIFNAQRDTPKNIPVSGYVKLEILHVHSPAYYSARLLEHSKTDVIYATQWTPQPNNYALIGFKLNRYYANRDNRCLHGRPKVGDIVGIEVEKDSLFCRAKVLEISARDARYDPTAVRVSFMDEGNEETVKVDELLGLPTELQDYPPEAIGVFLAKLKPMDLDTDWSYSATYTMKKLVESVSSSSDSTQYFCVGKIILAFGRSIVVDQLQFYEHLELAECNVVHLSLSQHILQVQLAVRNPNHIEDLCKTLGIKMPSEKNKVDPQIEMDEVAQWAHLDMDEYISVNIASVYSPSHFFIRIAKFYSMLQKLQKRMSKVLNNFRRSLEPHQLIRGMVCAAMSPSGTEWNRAQILEVTESKEVQIFFVDHGDTQTVKVKDLAQIPKGFISSFPFQIIECELIGVKPLGKQWLCEASDALYTMGLWENNVWKNLYVKVFDLDLKAEMTRGRHYKVSLVDTTGPTDVSINRQLVHLGFADWDPDTKRFLNDLTSQEIPSTLSDASSEDWDSGDASDSNENPEKLLTAEDREAMEKAKRLAPPTKSSSASSEKAMSIEEVFDYINKGDFDYYFEPGYLNSMYPGFSNYLEKVMQTNVKSFEDSAKTVPDCAGSEESSMTGVDEDKKKVKEGKKKVEEDKKVMEEKATKRQQENEESFGGRHCVPNGQWLTEVGTFVPVVYWRQTDTWVILKIDLVDVKDYHLRWTSTDLYFSTLLKENLYKVSLELFGPIEAETLVHRANGLYIEIKMEKVVKGHEWLRLTFKKEMYNWLKPDLQFVSEDASLVEKHYNRGVSSNAVLEPSGLIGYPGVPEVLSDSELHDSDVEEYGALPFDPFEPLT